MAVVSLVIVVTCVCCRWKSEVETAHHGGRIPCHSCDMCLL